MCDPVIGLTMAATAVAAMGQGYSALSQNAQEQYSAKVATQNARLENERARDAIERGFTEAQRFQRQSGQEMGAQNAAMAANGIDITFGSAADVRGDTAMFAREDTATIYQNAFREARGYEINSANFLTERQAAKMRGTGALVEGAFGIGSTVLGGATQLSKMKWARDRGLPY
jgi:hypothetical protein